jgi:hypothetical protein
MELEIIDNKAILLKLRDPNKVTTVIPKSKYMGNNQVLVNWGLDEMQVLKNLQIKISYHLLYQSTIGQACISLSNTKR